MDIQLVLTIIVYIFMLLIVYALGSGLYYIVFKKGNSEKAAKALTARIALSLTLFILLFIAFAFGWVKPHGLIPTANTQKQIGTTTPHPQSANTTPPPQNQNDAPE